MIVRKVALLAAPVLGLAVLAAPMVSAAETPEKGPHAYLKVAKKVNAKDGQFTISGTCTVMKDSKIGAGYVFANVDSKDLQVKEVSVSQEGKFAVAGVFAHGAKDGSYSVSLLCNSEDSATPAKGAASGKVAVVLGAKKPVGAPKTGGE